jgi:hypothetical protein
MDMNGLSQTKRRLVGFTVIAAVCAAVVGAMVALASNGPARDGLSRQKVTELAEREMTPAEYLRIKHDGEAVEAKNAKAAQTEPAPDPSVVAPRLLREEHHWELAAWKQLYESRLHERVVESWTVHSLNEKQTVAALQLVATTQRKTVLSSPAEWVFNFSLSAAPTPAEQQIANSPRGIEATTATARLLERLPAPRAGRQLPVEFYAVEDLSPGANVILADTPAPFAYKPWLIMRSGSRDEALQRGQLLAQHAIRGVRELKLARHVAVFREPVESANGGKARPRRRSSIYELSHLFNQGPVPMILRWRTGASGASALLRRPVEELILLR